MSALMPEHVPPEPDAYFNSTEQTASPKQVATIKRFMWRANVHDDMVADWCGDGFDGIDKLSKRAASWLILRLSVLYKAQCEDSDRLDLWEAT